MGGGKDEDRDEDEDEDEDGAVISVIGGGRDELCTLDDHVSGLIIGVGFFPAI
jgi:hypothetical protein